MISHLKVLSMQYEYLIYSMDVFLRSIGVNLLQAYHKDFGRKRTSGFLSTAYANTKQFMGKQKVFFRKVILYILNLI